MERDALKAVINLVEVSKLVDLTDLLEHRVVEECVALFNCNGTYRKTQKSNLTQNSLCRLPQQKANKRKMVHHTRQWSYYVHKLASIILSRPLLLEHSRCCCVAVATRDGYKQ